MTIELILDFNIFLLDILLMIAASSTLQYSSVWLPPH